MPYKRKGLCVYNSATGEKKGCSDTVEEAKAYMRKLYLEESKEKSKDYHPDVYYLNSSIRYLDSLIEEAQYCIQYAEHDELKRFFESQIESLTDQLIQLAEWRIEWYGDEDQLKEMTREDIEQLLKANNDTLFERVKSILKPPTPQAVELIKQDDGRTRVLLRVSNNFKDRHGEIITTEAHENYVSYVQETKDYPEFWLWHTPGTRWGQADVVYFDNGFLTMSGLVDQDKEYIADGLVAAGSELGVSHGFKGVKLHDKEHIDWYRTHEASPLPRSEAANLWTGVELLKEASMGIDTKHRDFFKLVGVPEDKINEWDASSKDMGEMLREAGVIYKEANTEPTPDPEPDPDPKPDEPTNAQILEAVNALNEKIKSIETKQKELESKVEDPVAFVLEAAVKQGATIGDPATKANDNAPSNTTSKPSQRDEEFAELFLGTGAK